MKEISPMIPKLGVNVDHVATLRQARGVAYPDPVHAAAVAEQAGADQITVHLRMDRRHIQERDIELLARTVQTRLNVEMAATEEMLEVALRARPGTVTLVPERAGEVTTEGGLDLSVPAVRAAVAPAAARLREQGIEVSLFIDPEPEQVRVSVELGASVVELNTAAYAEAGDREVRARELARVARAADAARSAGLYLAAGHGLHYHNVEPLAALGTIEEYNIGHAIVARAVFSGLDAAVRDMKALLVG